MPGVRRFPSCAEMSIDKAGKWWVGTTPADIEIYLEAYAQDGYPTSEFRLAKCACGSDVFSLEADDAQGVAKRICALCRAERYICDSEEYRGEASPERWGCVECGAARANVGVGFSLNDDGEVRWLYVGERCADCGVLGCFAEWKVGYAPSRHLLDQV
jgi:hypothetical protein